MPQEAELLKAVLDKPDDDAPRQAYAAWCKSTDPARAELIGLQLELARTDGNPNEPRVLLPSLQCDRLIEANRARWTRNLVPPATGCTFYRGFPEEVSLTVTAFLEQGAHLFQHAPIRHLTLSHPDGKTQDIFASPLLAEIRSLAFEHAGLTDDDLRGLADSPSLGKLRWLSLARNELEFFGINLLAGSKSLPALRWVNLRGNRTDPSEQYSSDQGVIVDAWLPREGKQLEKMHGPIKWLHWPAATTTRDLPPDRFRI